MNKRRRERLDELRAEGIRPESVRQVLSKKTSLQQNQEADKGQLDDKAMELYGEKYEDLNSDQKRKVESRVFVT